MQISRRPRGVGWSTSSPETRRPRLRCWHRFERHCRAAAEQRSTPKQPAVASFLGGNSSRRERERLLLLLLLLLLLSFLSSPSGRSPLRSAAVVTARDQAPPATSNIITTTTTSHDHDQCVSIFKNQKSFPPKPKSKRRKKQTD